MAKKIVLTSLTTEEVAIIKERYKKIIKAQKYSFIDELRSVIFTLKHFPKNDLYHTYQLSERNIDKINHCVCLKDLLVLFSPKKITKSKVFFVQKAYNPELFHELAFEMKDKMSKSRLPRKYWEE